MSDPDATRSTGGSDYLDRRKKADWIVRMATILSVLSWAVVIAVWAVLDAASPERERQFISSIIRKHLDVQSYVRTRWDETLLSVGFLLLVASLAVCLVAFFFNKLRMKRKTDKYRKSIIVIGSITIMGIVAFLIRFGWPF